MKTRKYMYLVLVLISVGFAAVSTTLLIDGFISISSNSEDFNVYFSDVSPHANWLVNGQHWWTKSARVNEGNIWYVNVNGILYGIENTSSGGIRPIITISKSDI